VFVGYQNDLHFATVQSCFLFQPVNVTANVLGHNCVREGVCVFSVQYVNLCTPWPRNSILECGLLTAKGELRQPLGRGCGVAVPR